MQCENCKLTGTVQVDNKLPHGWFWVGDSTDIVVAFCNPECIYHYIAKKMSETTIKDAQAVEKLGVFTRRF